MSTEVSPEYGWPAKRISLLNVLRYDTPRSRAPGSPARRAHDFDQHVVKWTGWSFITWLFLPRLGAFKLDPPVMLRSIGARTGRRHDTALTAFREADGSWIVLATNGGLSGNPDWVANLRHESKCWVRYLRRDWPALAEELNGADRDRVVDWVVQQYPVLAPYSERARQGGRVIPLFRLGLRDQDAPQA